MLTRFAARAIRDFLHGQHDLHADERLLAVAVLAFAGWLMPCAAVGLMLGDITIWLAVRERETP